VTGDMGRITIAVALTLLAMHAANADGHTVMFVKGMAYGIAEHCPKLHVDWEGVRKTRCSLATSPAIFTTLWTA